jgi:hypothetical protein
MRVRLPLVAAVFCLAAVVAPPGASALPGDPCPEPQLNAICEDPGEDPGILAVDVTTSPMATVGSPMSDDENLTYNVQVSNMNGIDDADSVQLTSEFTQGGATFVSSSANQGSCTQYTRNLGTIAANEMATVTLVVHPNAGTLKNKLTATSTTLAGDNEIQTSTVRSSSPTAAIDWSMPQRARDANNDGLSDAGPPPGGYTPSSWSVTLDACGSQPGHKTISQYKWEVQGLPEQVTSNCQHTITVPREQVYPAKLTVMLTDGSSVTANRDVKVVDRLICASGEGNPHSFIQYGSGVVNAWPTWDDTRCHRSMWASSARAARVLEAEDPHSSVTYLSKACSGAQISAGILGTYAGIEPSGAPLPPQIDQVRAVVGNARIDDLLISIGGNDAGFATIIADCMLPGDCFNNTTLVANHNAAIQALNTRHYPAMRTALDNATTGLNAESTFITEYPDFTKNATGDTCDTMGADILWPLSINKAEAQWASDTVLANITNMLEHQVDLAKDAGDDWNYVGGVQDAWRQAGQFGHGYCVGDPGVRNPTAGCGRSRTRATSRDRRRATCSGRTTATRTPPPGSSTRTRPATGPSPSAMWPRSARSRPCSIRSRLQAVAAATRARAVAIRARAATRATCLTCRTATAPAWGRTCPPTRLSSAAPAGPRPSPASARRSRARSARSA